MALSGQIALSGSLSPQPLSPMQAADIGRSGVPKKRSCIRGLGLLSKIAPTMRHSPKAVKLNNFPWRRLLLLLLAISLLIWVSRTISLQETLATLARLGPGDIALLAVVNLAILSTFAGRWWLLLRVQGEHVPYWRLLAYRVTAFSISYFTPGAHFGGEPYQIYAVSRWHGAPAAISIAAVTLDKLLEMLINFA